VGGWAGRGLALYRFWEGTNSALTRSLVTLCLRLGCCFRFFLSLHQPKQPTGPHP